jgi:hypothetical protein
VHKDHDIFIQSVERETKLKLTFFSSKHRRRGGSRTAPTICAPLHYSRGPAGLAPGAEDEFECYYLWDFGAKKGSNFLALSPSEIVSMKLTEDIFNVQEFYSQSSRAEKPLKSPDV